MTSAEARALVADGLVSVREAAAFLGLSRTKIWEMMGDGTLSFCHMPGYGNAARRIPKKALVDWAAARVYPRPIDS